MSYCRKPFYIYPCVCDGRSTMHLKGPHVVFSGETAISRDELAVFVASADIRGELFELLEAGRALMAGGANKAS